MAGVKPKGMPDDNNVVSYDSMLGKKAAETPSDIMAFLDDDEFLKASGAESQMDWERIWGGMPQYIPKNTEPVKQLIINFDTWEDYARFTEEFKAPITPKTKSVFWPFREVSVLDFFRWVDDGEAE